VAPLKHYRVINQRLVEQLALQLGISIGGSSTTQGGAEVGASGVKAQIQRQSSTAPLSPANPKVVEAVVEGLRDNGQLSGLRPERVKDLWDAGLHYVWEIVTATPVYLPIPERLRSLPTATDLNIWVSDPLPMLEERKGHWDYAGAYLFIVEEVSDVALPSQTTLSGVSALRMIVDCIATGTSPTSNDLQQLLRSDDRMGRWFALDPVAKLASIGGIPSRPREIETVYKIAYMTDEQTSMSEGELRRVCDIFAYPLYIAD
jgi:hypothetical protein